MNDTVLQLIIGVAGSSLITTLIAAIFNRNKGRAETSQVEADATKLIREAASGMMQEFKDDNADLRTRNQKLEEESDELRSKVRDKDRELGRRDDIIADLGRAIEQTARIIVEKGHELREFPLLQRALDTIRNR